MKWFDGSIDDAVNEANKRNSSFVVYVEGFDRSSEIMTEILNSQDICALLETNNYVSVRVKFDSEQYHHFVEMYKHVPVPSFFVIGENGVPNAIVKNVYGEDAKALHQQIKNALLTKGKGLADNFVQAGTEDSRQPELIYEERIALSSPSLNRDKHVQNNDEISVHVNFDFLNSPSAVVDSSLGSKTESDDEKQNKKESNVFSNNSCSTNFKQAMDETEKENKKDPVASRSYSKSKRQTNNDEDIRKQEIQQERIRIKKDRQRILYDIAIDKQERMLRQQSEIEKLPISNNLPETNSHILVTSLRASETQIQFRKPDSSTHTKIFNKSSTINELHLYVVQHIHINSRRFKLGTAFPRHIFTEDERGKSLEQLNLIPSAVIIIIPVSEGSSVLKFMCSHVYFAFMYVTQPVANLFYYIRDSLFQPAPQPQIQQGVLRPQQETHDQPTVTARISARSRKLAHQGSSMGQRNVHTMAHVKSDKKEDRNNVWNGNSTQQTQ